MRILSGATGLSLNVGGYTGLLGWNYTGPVNNTAIGIGTQGNNKITINSSGVYYVAAKIHSLSTSLGSTKASIFVNGNATNLFSYNSVATARCSN